MPIRPGFTCAFCGSTESPSLLEVEERMFGLGDQFTMAICPSCGSLHLQDAPDDLTKYYPEAYYAHQQLVTATHFRNLLKRIRYILFGLIKSDYLRPIFGEWMSETDTGPNDLIADIGCGNGQLLYEMRAAGFKRLRGFDPFLKQDIDLGHGLRLEKKSIFEIEEQFDLLMMHHSFEHMADPDKVLAQAYDALVPGGRLLIRVPVADAEILQSEGAHWVQLDAPRHLHIPSVNGLCLLAGQIGFQTQKVAFDSNAFQFWGTELYKRNKSLEDRNHLDEFSISELAGFERKARALNEAKKGDQACFYFLKPSS